MIFKLQTLDFLQIDCKYFEKRTASVVSEKNVVMKKLILQKLQVF